jgi:hypothetical protein
MAALIGLSAAVQRGGSLGAVIGWNVFSADAPAVDRTVFCGARSAREHKNARQHDHQGHELEISRSSLSREATEPLSVEGPK